MWPLFVVLLEPLFRLFTHLVQTLKHIHVEHRLAVAAIESFNESILHRFARFDELTHHAVLFGPFSQGQRDELRTVVCSKLEARAADSGYPFKLRHHPLGSQAKIHRDRQRFALEVINHIEGAKATAFPQRIAHEVCCPTFVHRLGGLQRRRVPCWHPSLALPSFVQFQAAIHPMHSLVIPAPALPSQPLEQLRKSFLRPPVRQLQKQLDEFPVATRSAPIAVHRSSQAHRLTGPTLGQFMLSSQLPHQFALDRRRYSFFAITSFSARVSSNNSADICFKRRFSSSSSRSRRMSAASIPPYFVFHL